MESNELSGLRIFSFEAVPCPIQTASPTILIIEDDIDNRESLSAYLKAKGYAVLQAENGFDGLQLARIHRPLMVLLDLGLPGMGGIEAIRLFRGNAELSLIPIIVVSGHAVASTQNLARAAGCDEYLAKPVSFNRLDDILGQYAPLSPNA